MVFLKRFVWAMVPRIKRRRDFVRVSQKGGSAPTPSFIIQAFMREEQDSRGAILPKVRVGFTATKRLGNAVRRNRARRRLRSLVEVWVPQFQMENVDLVLIAKHSCLKRSFAELGKELCEGLQRLHFSCTPLEQKPSSCTF